MENVDREFAEELAEAGLPPLSTQARQAGILDVLGQALDGDTMALGATAAPVGPSGGASLGRMAGGSVGAEVGRVVGIGALTPKMALRFGRAINFFPNMRRDMQRFAGQQLDRFAQTGAPARLGVAAFRAAKAGAPGGLAARGITGATSPALSVDLPAAPLSAEGLEAAGAQLPTLLATDPVLIRRLAREIAAEHPELPPDSPKLRQLLREKFEALQKSRSRFR
jgi:hypothetical protein